MTRKAAFTQEQLERILSNPFTHNATSNSLSFTKEFKEFFYKQMTEHNLPTPEIIKLAGYDPAEFGKPRLDMIRRIVRQEASSPEGFKDPRGLSHSELLKKENEKLEKARNTEAQIQVLQNRVAHLEAQIEFLKKTARIRKKNQTEAGE